MARGSFGAMRLAATRPIHSNKHSKTERRIPRRLSEDHFARNFDPATGVQDWRERWYMYFGLSASQVILVCEEKFAFLLLLIKK